MDGRLSHRRVRVPAPRAAVDVVEASFEAAPREVMRKTLVAAIAVALVALTIAYRVLTLGGPLGGFENDQFVTLSQAQQVVMGDWPVRDFDVLGQPLTVMLSALGQTLFGHTLLAEALTTAGLIGLCTAILFLLSWRASGSIPIAVIVALIQVAMAPRFYNFPKLLAYALAIPAMWWYLDHPSRPRLAGIALAGALAFLLRHDHGLYVGLAAIVAVGLAHQPDVRRVASDLAVLGALTLAIVSPYLFFVQAHGGLVPYLESFARYGSETARRTAFSGAPMSFDWSQPLATLESAPVPQPRINIRWAGGVTDARRTAIERALGLSQPEPRATDVINYALADASTAHLADIVHDPSVADTEGIDRQTYVLNDPQFTHVPTRADRAVAYVRRVRLLPGILRGVNAIPFLYYLMYAAPLAAFIIGFYRGDAASPVPWKRAGAKITVVAVLALLIDRSFLRGNLDSRLADVSEVVGVLAAWVAAVMMAQLSRVGRIAAAVVLLLVFAGTLFSVEATERVSAQVGQTGLTSGPRSLLAQAAAIREALGGTPPVSALPDTPGMERVARYVNACTAPGDRVLVIGYMPEIFFLSQRAFAAGGVWIQPHFFDTAADQRLMIDRIGRYRVPIVITVPEPEFTTEYVASFPVLTTLLRTEYQEIATTDFGRGFRFRILARQGVAPTGTFPADQLPCFS